MSKNNETNDYVLDSARCLKANIAICEKKIMSPETSFIGKGQAKHLLKVFLAVLQKLEEHDVPEKNKVLLIDNLNVTYLLLPEIN